VKILKGILRHIEIQRFKKCGLGRERFITLGESYQTSVRWRISYVVHTFIVASVLGGLDFVRIEVEVQKVLKFQQNEPDIATIRYGDAGEKSYKAERYDLSV
jgi:hypothetical protein